MIQSDDPMNQKNVNPGLKKTNGLQMLQILEGTLEKN